MANEFIDNATSILTEVVKIMDERGQQYADTWGKDGCWHLTRAILAKYSDTKFDETALKAIALASFCDQKYSRFAGGYKEDTVIDLIPYLGALANLLKK
jgi:hypothetical protein